MTPLKRLSGRRLAALILGILLLIGVGLALEIRSAADRAWKGMEDRTNALIAEARSRPAARSVLRGTPEPGSAWIHYEAALDLYGSDRAGHNDVYKFLRGDANASRAAVEQRVSRHEVALDELRRGVRRAEGAFPYDWHAQNPLEDLHLLGLSELAMLAAAKARLEREAGKTRESADILLDLLQFGGDVRRNSILLSDMIGLSILSNPLHEFPSLLNDPSLRPSDWEAIGRELEILDREWPAFTATLRNTSLLTQASLMKPGEDPPSFWETWRYGFSRRMMTAGAGALFHRHLEALVQLESRPWRERLATEAAITRELEASTNPLFQVGTLLSSCASERLRRAQLRMIRLVVQYRIRGAVGDLPDPFGTQLHHLIEESRVRIWSVGRDGLDQGGKGEWQVDRGNGDVVLEITR